jgi:hypothetical protein
MIARPEGFDDFSNVVDWRSLPSDGSVALLAER